MTKDIMDFRIYADSFRFYLSSCLFINSDFDAVALIA